LSSAFFIAKLRKISALTPSFVHILLGIVIILAGTAMTIKGEWLYQNFGTIAFFEKYMHSAGGGRLGYKLMGVLAIFIGVLIMTNVMNDVLQWVASLFTFGGQPR